MIDKTTFDAKSYAIQQGRQFMHGNLSTGSCCSCGGELTEARPLNKVIKSTFTAFDAFVRGAGNMVCSGCQSLLDNPKLRFNSVGYYAPGKFDVLTPAEIRPWITGQKNNFVVSMAYSHQKHHWLYAGLSNQENIYFGTDNQTVFYDLKTHEIVKDTIAILVDHGVGVTQIITGQYHPATCHKVGATWLIDTDKVLAPHRPTGLVELLVKIAPRRDKNQTLLKEDNIMIDPLDQQAAEYLSQLARCSNYRIEKGLEFWGGFFLYRVNRVSRLPLAEATNKLIGTLQIPTPQAGEHIIPRLKELTEQQTAEIETSIREHTKLIVALAYSLLKEKRGKTNANAI